MVTIPELRDNKLQGSVLVVGLHIPIIQSILDFDYLCGKKAPSIAGIVSGASGYVKLFWGKEERLFTTYSSIDQAEKNKDIKKRIRFFLNMLSGRRVYKSGVELMEKFPFLKAGVFFAENVPEQVSLSLYREACDRDIMCIGPASVGIVVPGYIKIGPIGGVDAVQIGQHSLVNTGGNIAIVSGSGGMSGELINIASQTGRGISIAVSYGGDRFPILTPQKIFALLESDPQTKIILYYGELGGYDEYEIIKMKKQRKITKPIIAHIAGTVGELFNQSYQFGHAKARASFKKETANAKRIALRNAGLSVGNNYQDFIELINSHINNQ